MPSELAAYSVLMGVYEKDNPEYFDEALSSMLNQSYPSDDFVLVADGPLTKELQDIVDKYQSTHPEINFIQLEENLGQGRAFNIALKDCVHDYVARMDADDYSHPNRMEIQMTYLKEHPEIDLLSANIAEFVNERTNIVSHRNLPGEMKEIRKFANRFSPVNQPVTVFRKSKVIEAGSYQDFYRHEDYYLWVRMMLKGAQVANIQEVLLDYRLSSENLKRRTNWKTTKSAIRFHFWKHKVGFTNLFDTLLMSSVMLAIFITPDKIFEWLYQKARD